MAADKFTDCVRRNGISRMFEVIAVVMVGDELVSSTAHCENRTTGLMNDVGEIDQQPAACEAQLYCITNTAYPCHGATQEWCGKAHCLRSSVEIHGKNSRLHALDYH